VLSSSIDLWDIDLADEAWDAEASVLSAEEKARFARMAPTPMKSAKRRGRIALRAVLAGYCGAPPERLDFAYGAFGKPRLLGTELEFNLSHSGARALIAVACEPLGVDIEQLDQKVGNIDNLLRLICSDSEPAPSSEDDEVRRRARFFHLWTRKEAYCKATGQGLHKDMRAFSIAKDGDRTFIIDPAASEPCRELVDLPMGYGWMACLCTHQPAPSIRRLHAKPAERAARN